MMSQMFSLIVIHFYSYDSFSCVASSFFPWLCYCAYWGCVSWLISDSFLTHIILHAGRIFQQQHHNHIVCLVVETALHVYQGQFSPWLGQFITGIYHLNFSSELIMGTHHLYSLDSISALSQVKSNTWPPDLECQKLSDFLVTMLHHHCLHHQLPGPIVTWESHFKFELHILGLCLNVCWVLGIRKEKSASNIKVTNTTRNRSWSSGLLIC